MATTRTAAQILDPSRVYTAAMCADAADARIALEALYEQCSTAELLLPAVLRRVISLRKALAKFDPTAFEDAPTKQAPAVPAKSYREQLDKDLKAGRHYRQPPGSPNLREILRQV